MHMVMFSKTYDSLKMILGDFPVENIQMIVDPDGRYISIGVYTIGINWADIIKPIVANKTGMDDFDMEVVATPNLIGLFRTYVPIEMESTTDVTKFKILVNCMSDYPEEDEEVIREQCYIELELIIQSVVEIFKRSKLAWDMMQALSTT